MFATTFVEDLCLYISAGFLTCIRMMVALAVTYRL